MNYMFKKLAILALISVGVMSPTCKAQEDTKTIDIETQAPQEILPVTPSIILNVDTMIENARLAFFDALLKEQQANPKSFSHLIDPSHINSITFLDENNGQILLSLIAELEKNQNGESPLLQSLNELCMLEFSKFLCSESIDKETRAKLTTVLGDMYHKEATIDTSSFIVVMPKDQYPFRTLISKTLLTVSLVNNTRSLGYQQKCETIAFLLTHLKQEFVAINNTLAKSNQVSAESITYLIEKLSVLGINAPLISAKTLKTIIIITVVIAIIATVIYVWYNYYGGKDWVWNNLNAISNTIKNAFRSAGEEVAAGASKKIKKTVEKELEKLFEKDKNGNNVLRADIKKASKDLTDSVKDSVMSAIFKTDEDGKFATDKDGNFMLRPDIKIASKDLTDSVKDSVLSAFFKTDKDGNFVLRPDIKIASKEMVDILKDSALSAIFKTDEDGKFILDEKGRKILIPDYEKSLNKISNKVLFDKLKETYIVPGNGPVYNPKPKPQPPSSQQNDCNNSNDCNKNGFTDNIEFPNI